MSKSVVEGVRNAVGKGENQILFDTDGAAIDQPPNFEAGNNAMAEQYPNKHLGAEDKNDEKYEIMQRLAKKDHPLGAPKWNDDVLRWIKKKQDAGIKAEFQKWFAQEFDKMNPTAKAYARQMYPNFYAERMQTLKLNASLLEQLASIRLRGVTSKSDLYLQYAADNGLIDLSGIEDILHPDGTKEDEEVEFERGLFNPRRRYPGFTRSTTERDKSYSVWGGQDNTAPAYNDTFYKPHRKVQFPF